mgnify:FL=1
MSLALLIVKVNDRDGFVEMRLECEDKGSLAEHIIEELVAAYLEVEDDKPN